MTRYRTIVADPPWTVMGGPSWGGGSSKPLPYPTMSTDEIAALDVGALAAKDAHLYVWTINAYIQQTYDIVRAWGFKPSTLLTWTKAHHRGGAGWHVPALHRVGPVRSARDARRQAAGRPVALRLAQAASALAQAGRVPRHG